jgi:uracil-DNA glycosylase
LINTIETMPALRAILTLGKISHDSVLRALGAKLSAHPFVHGARHDLGPVAVFDSYHCSRYNTNTGVLTTPMFENVFAAIRQEVA